MLECSSNPLKARRGIA